MYFLMNLGGYFKYRKRWFIFRILMILCNLRQVKFWNTLNYFSKLFTIIPFSIFRPFYHIT